MNLAWKEKSREVVQEWFGKQLEKVVYEMPDGRDEEFFVRRQPDTASILALTPANEVILARQFRPGKGVVIDELPGGGLKPGQTPEEAAAAELLEETGYAGKLQFVTESWPDGYCTRKSFTFVATDCVPVAGGQRLDQNEFIEVVRMPLEEFKKYMRGAKLTDVETAFLGLDYLNLL